MWAPIGERPLALVHHRACVAVSLWLCASPEWTQWLILPRVNVDWFNAALANSAKATGANATHHIVLILAHAGWHRSEKVVVPEGIHLLFLPPYSPELQPAERLWELVDQPLVNRSFDTLDD